MLVLLAAVDTATIVADAAGDADAALAYVLMVMLMLLWCCWLMMLMTVQGDGRAVH